MPCSLTACTAGSSVCILAGVAGEGAALMQQQLLTTDRNLSGAVCNLQSAPFLYQNVTSAEAAEDLPPVSANVLAKGHSSSWVLGRSG